MSRKQAAAGKPAPRKAPAREVETAPERLPARRARLALPRELWGRRAIAVGVLLVGAALLGGLILLIAGGDGDEGKAPSNSKSVTELQDKFLKHTVVDVEKGISVRRPGNWKDTKDNHVITLTSHDACVAMTLGAPQSADDANNLHDQSLALFRRSFDAKVHPTPDSEIGGIPTKSDRVTFRAKGHQIRVLLSVGKGDKYAYLTEIVVRGPSCQGSLNLAQLVLTSVEYTK